MPLCYDDSSCSDGQSAGNASPTRTLSAVSRRRENDSDRFNALNLSICIIMIVVFLLPRVWILISRESQKDVGHLPQEEIEEAGREERPEISPADRDNLPSWRLSKLLLLLPVSCGRSPTFTRGGVSVLPPTNRRQVDGVGGRVRRRNAVNLHNGESLLT